jgi:hypothetical protein
MKKVIKKFAGNLKLFTFATLFKKKEFDINKQFKKFFGV